MKYVEWILKLESIFEEFCIRVHLIPNADSSTNRLPIFICAMDEKMINPLLDRLNNLYVAQTNYTSDFEREYLKYLRSKENENLVCFIPKITLDKTKKEF